MKFAYSIVFSVVLLQQIMNLGVQADTQCTAKSNKSCDNFKLVGQLCTCDTVDTPEPMGLIFPSACEKTINSADPKDNKPCPTDGPEISRCIFFCNSSGKSCSASGCIGK